MKEMGVVSLDPSFSKAVGTMLSLPADRSVKTAARGTPTVAMAIVKPSNAIEGALKLKGSSGSGPMRPES
ncbi:Conserved hypothetical protein [Prochlorococcus marinus str. MIT 9303]|uniref:Uncharacterized protein n=2 Tax=Prochlorococcaceae TaxID=2881426 RepID=A2C7N7_PROM3|nr:Conserved hypothetical protein [Prochlorococcus marinus str. MIT 9303]